MSVYAWLCWPERGEDCLIQTTGSSATVMGILNFSPSVLAVPEDVMVNNVNLAIELENLSYFIQA
jgi:NADH/NAD ratio-sensing transcriptional regulator Rex